MNVRRMLFYLGFLVVPMAFWIVSVNPALGRRNSALERQSNAGKVIAEADKAVQQRDKLLSRWQVFRPVAEKALANMGQDLNPLLVPRRLASLAETEYDLQDMRIQPVNNEDEAEIYEFSFNANGNYENLVEFIDDLERGRQRIRFQNVKIMTKPGYTSQSNPQLNLAASFLVPAVPSQPEPIKALEETVPAATSAQPTPEQ